MTFTRDTARILARVWAGLALIGDEHTREQAARWARAWDDVAPELQAALDELALGDEPPTRAQLQRARRLTNALAVIEDRLADLVDGSAASAVSRLGEIVDAAGRSTDELIASELPAGTRVDGWTRVDPRAADAIVERAGQQITALSWPISSEATAVIRREIVRGMLTGANPRETARRMIARTEGHFNGGLSRALTIARTEQMDAHRAAAALAERANADVLEGWVWVADLSTRTCPACWAMNGTIHALDEPGPLGHQNCRCARVPKTRSWRELGFDVDEPAGVWPDSRAEFARLSPAEQREILGPRRFAAWRDGDYPMSRWATRRETPGWRPSWVVSPAPVAA